MSYAPATPAISSSRRRVTEGPWAVLGASLLPTIACLASLLVTDPDRPAVSKVSFWTYLTWSPVLLLFVSVPSVLAIAAAPPGWLRAATTAVMSAVAWIAAALAIRTDDAQAGFWLFLVGQVAIPLATLLGVTRLVLDHRRRTRWSSLPPPPS